MDENTIFVQNTAFIFDGSAIEIFSSLLCGGRLRLVSDTDRKEPEMFLKRIKNANIYILPSMFRAVMDYAITNGLEKELNSYHRLGLVAEKIPEDLIERLVPNNGVGYDIARIEMKALPITSNGKLDKKALPSPKSNIEKKSITLPRTDTEREMVKLFIKVLNVENVDIDDSFYSLGGHSLKMTRLLNEIEKKFGKRLSLRNVMEAKTVRRISYLIDNEDEQKVKKMSGLSVAKPIN